MLSLIMGLLDILDLINLHLNPCNFTQHRRRHRLSHHRRHTPHHRHRPQPVIRVHFIGSRVVFLMFFQRHQRHRRQFFRENHFYTGVDTHGFQFFPDRFGQRIVYGNITGLLIVLLMSFIWMRVGSHFIPAPQELTTFMFFYTHS